MLTGVLLVTYTSRQMRMDDDVVFKALADPHRRAMLNALRDRDGQSLRELSEPVPMTRYGVMKHLILLEEAGLITTERGGGAEGVDRREDNQALLLWKRRGGGLEARRTLPLHAIGRGRRPGRRMGAYSVRPEDISGNRR